VKQCRHDEANREMVILLAQSILADPGCTAEERAAAVAALEREIARCDAEIAAMYTQEPVKPAYLTTLGIQDWEGEKRILQSIAAIRSTEVPS
jgi:hypothetical protein